ncbi:MAG: carbohydrate-binding protein [Clostridia bacterium]|nr:carbohydrate-binding protein [Clostridia bacterium]
MPRAKKAAEASNNEYMSNGVKLSPAIPSPGDRVKIIYDGLLSKSGATDVIARVGFDEEWRNLYDYRMERTHTGFEVSVPVSNADSINIAFKDCANNWDNNSGKNYTFDISQ